MFGEDFQVRREIMAISKRTMEEIHAELISWMADYQVGGTAMKSLFRRLVHVRGNKSFLDSIKMLHEYVEKTF